MDNNEGKEEFWGIVKDAAYVGAGVGLGVGLIVGTTVVAPAVATVLVSTVIGGAAGYAIGGTGAFVALHALANAWKKKYCKKIQNWIAQNLKDETELKEFILDIVENVSEATAYALRTRKSVKANLFAVDKNNRRTQITTVTLNPDELVALSMSKKKVYKPKEILEMCHSN